MSWWAEFWVSFAWRLPLWLGIMAFGEWWVHYFFMHRRRWGLGWIYRWHHIEHHAQKQNKLRPHIDLAIGDYVLAYPCLAIAAWRAWHGSAAGTAALAAILSVCLGHMILWNLLHRNMHDTGRENFLRHWSWFPAFAKHHEGHHKNPFSNYSVVFIFMDSLMGTKYAGPSASGSDPG